MSSKIKGITLTVGGDTSGLRKELSQVNKESASIQKELREVEKALKFDPKNTDILRQKQKLLNDEIEATEKALLEMKKAQEKADKAIKEGTEVSEEQYRMLQREIAKTEAKLKDLKDAGKKTNDELGEGEKKTNWLDDFKNKLKDTKGVITGVAAGATALVAGLSAIEEETREYRSDLAKLKTNADAAGVGFDNMKKQLFSVTALTDEADSSIEALSNLLKTNISESGIEKIIQELSGAVIAFPDTLKIESLADGLQETLATGKGVGQFSELLERCGFNLDDFNKGLEEAKKRGEEEQYILDTLAKTGMADINASYVETNSNLIKIKTAQQEWNDTLAIIGEKVAPAKAEIIGFVASLAEGAITMAEDASQTQKILDSTQEFCDAYYAKREAIDETMISELSEIERGKDLFRELQGLVAIEDELTGKKKERANYIADELQEILGVEIDTNGDVKKSVEDIRLEVEKLIIAKQAEALLVAQKEKITEAEKNHNAVIERQNEILAEIDELESKSAYGRNLTSKKYAIKELQEEYDELLEITKIYSEDTELYHEAITAAVQGNYEKVREILGEQGRYLISACDVATKTVEEQQQIMASQWETAVNSVKVAMDNYNAAPTEANEQLLKDAIEQANKTKAEYEKVGGAIVAGMIVGIDGKKIYIKAKVDELCEDIPVWARNLLAINSPSKVMRDQVGSAIPEGLAEGIILGEGFVKKAVNQLVTDTKNEFTKDDAFDINSPSGWGEEIGEFIDAGLANGIFDNIKLVQTSFRELFGEVEKEHEDLTKEEEKYNQELERIRAAGTEKANEAYLDNLKDLAEEAKERRKIIRDTYEDMVKDVQKSIDTLEKEMNSYQKGLAKTDLTETYDETLFIFNGEEIKQKKTVLANLSDKRKELEQFRDNLINLREIGIDESMLEQIKTLGGDKGRELAQALIDATPEERELFLNDFKAIGELSGQATAEVFKEEIQSATKDIGSLLGELDTDLLKVGEDWGYKLGQGLMTKLNETFQSMRGIIGSINFNYGSIPGLYGQGTGYGGTTVNYNTEINQTITSTPQTAFETAEETRRTMENINNMAVLG